MKAHKRRRVRRNITYDFERNTKGTERTRAAHPGCKIWCFYISCRTGCNKRAHRVAFKFQFADRKVPMKSSERFCGMQIHYGERTCKLNLGEQKREKHISRRRKRWPAVKQRASERRNREWVEGEWRDKRWSSEKWGRKAFHSYRILHSTFPSFFLFLSFLYWHARAHIRRCFSTLFSSVFIVAGSNRGRGRKRRRFLIFARFSYR